MQTVRQIERLWTGRMYVKLFRELIANRPEASFQSELTNINSTAAAAVAMIRLDELNQAHVPLFSKLIRALVASQEKDGGWGDAATTALCLRALMIGRNTGGEAIERGLKYLADLQRDEGLWPREPFRRMSGDPQTTSFVLYQLGAEDRFRAVVRIDDALTWFEQNRAALLPPVKNLWDRARLRCHTRLPREQVMVWS